MSEGSHASEAERRAAWRRRLSERGLVEKKITIRVEDSPLFSDIAERTRAGSCLADVLFDIASKAAPPPGDLDDGMLALAQPGTARLATDIPCRYEDHPWPPAGHGLEPWIARSSFGTAPTNPQADVDVPEARSPATAASPDDVPPVLVLDAASEDAASPGRIPPPPTSGGGGPLPASWRMNAPSSRSERLRRALAHFRSSASRTISPQQFLFVAVAIALFVASIVIYSLRTPTVEAAPIAGPSGPILATENEGAERLLLLEEENRRLADHLEALLSELETQKTKPGGGANPKPRMPSRKGPRS